ncbi:N-acetylglucosamine-1-phosphotransferase subunit gamma-like [Babylonia areolata]|uniref:N-acetylglucosamine-1-phosphotransferase subunit gamma-like n=1 Tax=Babylonia areolata TaxID=304850 RepID=UPI003FD60774
MADDTSYGVKTSSFVLVNTLSVNFIKMLSYASILVLCIYTQTVLASDVVEMKIVDEPSSYGFGNNNLQPWAANAEADEKLKMRVQPANVSGPPHLRYLHRHCFSKTFENYKYNLCPFSNVTQHEQGYHWNPYNGVLGVWQEWEIENNTFVSMEMMDGDDCGQIHRSVKVKFECGNSSDIVSVSEPSTCHYVLVFSTPLVCHPQSMLVYPTLSAHLRAKWDQLEGQRHRKELTEKGYKKRLQLILQEAGLRLTATERQHLSAAALAREQKEKEERGADFLSVSHCSQMYRRLQQELDQVKAELATFKNSSKTALNVSSSLIHSPS